MSAGEPVFQGRFHYVAGHPEHPDVPTSLTSRVLLSRDGLVYERKAFFGSAWEMVFRVATASMLSARTVVEGRSGLEWYGDDYFVDLDLEIGGEAFRLRLKAVGMTQEKDSFRLRDALNSLAADTQWRKRAGIAA